jgi:TonB family protein
MKHLFVTVIGAITFVAAPQLSAQGDVTNRYANWEHQLRDRVDDLLYYPQAANGAAGDVLVAFRIGANGLPTDIAVRQSSGVQILDQTAVQLVSRLGRIGPAPSADGDVQNIVFRISYSDRASTIAAMQLNKPDRIASDQGTTANASLNQGQPRR